MSEIKITKESLESFKREEEKVNHEELYDSICEVMTWYENPDEYPFGEDLFNKHIAEEMYKVLHRVLCEMFYN